MAGMELVYDGPSGVHGDTSVFATMRHFDFGRVFNLIGEKDIGNPVMSDLIVKTSTPLNSANQLEFLLLYTPERTERTAAHVAHSALYEDRELLRNRQDSTLIGANWTRLFGEDGIWENRFYYRKTDKTSREGEAFPFSDPPIDPIPADQIPVLEEILTLTEGETELGWRSDFSMGNRWGRFGSGLRIMDFDIDYSTVLSEELIRYEYDFRHRLGDSDDRYLLLTQEEVNSELNRAGNQYAVYAEQIFETDLWDVRAGARYEYDSFSGQGYASPRFSANYWISPVTRIAATAGTFYQSPRFLERAADPENADLLNERLDHVSLGIEQNFGALWELLVEAYYRLLSDLVTDINAGTGKATNNGDGTDYGVDVVLNRWFGRGWSANAVYGFNEATRDDHDGNGSYASDHNHRHMFSLGARWEITESWQVGARWKYATGRPRDEIKIHKNVFGIQGPRRFSQEIVRNNNLRWDSFHTLNVRGDYRRSLGDVDLVAFLDILNVYGNFATDVQEFNPTTGGAVLDDGEPIPLIGIRFEKTW